MFCIYARHVEMLRLQIRRDESLTKERIWIALGHTDSRIVMREVAKGGCGC